MLSLPSMAIQSGQTPSFEKLRAIFEESFPSSGTYSHLYQIFHELPDLLGQEELTSFIVPRNLESLGFDVESHVGGYGVFGILANR